MNKKLENATNIVLIITCLVVIIHLANTYLFNDSKQQFQEEISSGDILSDFETFIPTPKNKNLLIFISADCGYCEKSMPFYKRITEQESYPKTKVTFVTSTNHDPLAVKQLLSSSGIISDQVIQVDGRQWKIPYTPTILLTDKKGKVIEYWKGKLDKKKEKFVLNSFIRD